MDRQGAGRSRARIIWQAQGVASTFVLPGFDRTVDHFLQEEAHSCGEPFGTEDLDGETHEFVRRDLDSLADEIDHRIAQLPGSDLVNRACLSELSDGDVAVSSGWIKLASPDELAERIHPTQFARYERQERLRSCLREPGVTEPGGHGLGERLRCHRGCGLQRIGDGVLDQLA